MNDILGGSQVLGLLSPELQAQAEQRARSAGLTNLGFALLQASQGQPGQRRPGLGQIIGQAGPVGMQAYQQSFDRTLQDMLRAQQIQDMQRQREQQQAARAMESLRQQQLDAFIGGLPPEEQARFRAFPTQAAEAMFREQPEQFVQMTAEQVAARGLPANKTFQMSSKTGRISEVGGGGATVNIGGERDPFDVEVAKKQAPVFSQISNAGVTATRNLRKINRLENILNRIDTGGSAAFKQIAGNFGISVSKDTSDIQAATAIINSLVPEQRAEGSGPMSDADLELFKQSLPRIINQPGGNKLIIDGMKDINNYLIEESKIANDVIARKITPEEGRRKLLELGNPIDDFFAGGQPARSADGVPLPPQDEALIQKYLGGR